MEQQVFKLGVLLVRDGVVTQTQLNHALQIQKEQEVRQSLGEILVDLGFVTARKLRGAIKRYGKRALFGEVLVESGIITRGQLEEVLTEQKASGGTLGQILATKGILTPEELAQALGKQLDIPYMVPRLKLVDMKVFGRLPLSFVKRHSVIPVIEADGVTTVIVAEPTDRSLVQTLEDMFGADLDLAICSRPLIDRAIQGLARQTRFDVESRKAGFREEGDGRLRAELVIEGDRSVEVTEENLAEEVLDSIICDALEERASDVHIEPQRGRVRVRHRIDGVLLFRTDFPLSLASRIATRAKVLAKLDISTRPWQQEGRILAHVDGKEVDLRVTISRSIFGESLAIRIFSKDTGLMDLKDLGMLPAVLERYRRVIEQQSGLTLFVGPTGSGKTTSLYATLNHLNDGSRKIVTVEAPVEFPMDGTVQNSLPANESAGVTETLRGSLHQDPDVIALGEITSDDSASALLESGLMGHKVLSTQHAEDAACALVRLGNVHGATSFLSSCSLVIIAQRLVRKVCPSCAEVYVPSNEIVDAFHISDFDRDDFDFRTGSGCSECLGTGYRDRTGIFELLTVGADMRKFLFERPSARDIRQMVSKRPDFISLQHAGFLKAMQGITTLEDVLRVEPLVEVETTPERPITLKQLRHRAGLSLGNPFGKA